MRFNLSNIKIVGLLLAILHGITSMAGAQSNAPRIQRLQPAPALEQSVKDSEIKPMANSLTPKRQVRSKSLPKSFVQLSNTLQPGEVYLKQGKVNEAQTYFESKIAKMDSPVLKLQTEVLWADSLSRAARVQKDNATLVEQAKEKYLSVLPKVKGNLRLNTYNNYGTLLLRQDKAQEALTVLQEVEKNYARSSEPASHARYLYNLARASEKTGDLKSAKNYYRDAARKDKQFLPASRAWFRVSLKQEVNEGLIREAVSLLEEMLNQNNLTAAKKTYQLIFNQEAWVRQERFDRLLISFAQYMTATKLSPAKLEESWEFKVLNELIQKKVPVHKVAVEILSIYNDRVEFPITFQPGSHNEYFVKTLMGFSHGHRSSVLSALAKVAGDGFYADLQLPDKALERYALAWTLDNNNTEAALFAANLLLDKASDSGSENPYIVDLTGAFDNLISSLFNFKGRAYQSNDLENIFRLHLILGSIYEKQKKWGPSRSAQSAIFQFKHAIRTHEKLKYKKPETVGSVIGIRVSLAKAYEGAEQYKNSLLSYVDAIDEAVNEGEIEFAKDTLSNLDRLSPQVNLKPVDRRRLENLKKRLQSM